MRALDDDDDAEFKYLSKEVNGEDETLKTIDTLGGFDERASSEDSDLDLPLQPSNIRSRKSPGNLVSRPT